MSILGTLKKRFFAGIAFGANPWEKLKAAFGFCLISRLRCLNVILRLNNQRRSVFFSSGSDVAMFIEVFIDGEYLLPTDFFPKKILDIGANVGFASLYFACRDAEASLVAIEPDPSNFELLKRNMQGIRVKSMQNAVAGDSGVRTFFVVPRQGMSSSLQKREGSTEIQTQAFSFADLILSVGWQFVELVKFDVEGAEWEIFQAADLRMIGALIGEYHEDLVGKSIADFLALFPDFQSQVRQLTPMRYSVFLRRRKIV